MDKKAMEKMYAEKKAYVEKVIGAYLKPMSDFGSVQYARDPITNEEYIKVTESNDFPWYVNVTGNSLEAIGREVAKMVDHRIPNGNVPYKEKQKAVNKLFTKED